MYSAIQELFYGSYSASDLPASNVPGYRESLRHTIELSEQLRAGLNQEQKELFEAYCENANAGHALMGEAYCAQGVFPWGCGCCWRPSTRPGPADYISHRQPRWPVGPTTRMAQPTFLALAAPGHLMTSPGPPCWS